MNKSLGASVGAIVLAAFLFRTAGPVSTTHGPASSQSSELKQTAGKKSSGEGPWVASCEYWAPARLPAEPASEEQPDFTMKVDKAQNRITGNLPDSAQKSESECGDDDERRWGLPDSNQGLEVKTIIAIVPDPVRTNMALQFDRTIDALMGAAGEYQYVSSYYWLPWKEQSTRISLSEGPPGREESKSTRNEHEPGLIIFKYVPVPRPPNEHTPRTSTDEAYAKLLYLFLVAETPTTGIDGLQIQKAVQYQDQLMQNRTSVRRSFGDSGNLAIIGPTFSGSAASLRQAVESILENAHGVTSVSVNGATGTEVAIYHMTAAGETGLATTDKDHGCKVSANIEYRSFSYDSTYTQDRLLALLTQSSSFSNPARVAVLAEDGTTFGSAASAPIFSMAAKYEDCQSPVQVLPQAEPLVKPFLIRFPRGIFLLRNAQAESAVADAASTSGSPPSPYLHLSLKDANSYDSVPQLSRESTPLSQEAQLMTIARELNRQGSQYIVIVATNVLDQIFLAQFLHRACPDARLVFYNGDLLFEREVDNVPFIGTITFTPYPLINTGPTLIVGARRAYSDSVAQSYFNAASYTFWDHKQSITPALAGYRSMAEPSGNQMRPPLWVTAIGIDGYYPLGIASSQAADSQSTGDSILPLITPPNSGSGSLFALPIWPSRLWYVLCILVWILCIFHIWLLCAADPWSPLTRELAFKENDQPRRRSMYVHTGTTMLFCMAFVLAIPLYATFKFCLPDPSGILLSRITLFLATVAVAVTFWKTWKYIGWERLPAKQSESPSERRERLSLFLERNVYFLFNLIAWIALLAVPSIWTYLCYWDHGGYLAPQSSQVGLFFSFRCVHPDSGVSPIVPVLLLLFSWYLWAVFHTWRLRFSDNCRPILPGGLAAGTSYPLFVPDEALCDCERPRSACLYKNITCLLITREVLRRFLLALVEGFQKRYMAIFNIALVVLYLVLFALFELFIPIRSLDAFFWASRGIPTPYELLVTALFFPLLLITLSGWIRMILVWGSLKRHLLERLENLPIRNAFSRLKAAGWMTMLRSGGMHEQWRDMARSAESMRQMANDPGLDAHLSNQTLTATASNQGGAALSGPINPLVVIDRILNLYIEGIVEHRSGNVPQPGLLLVAREFLARQSDLPEDRDDTGLVLMNAIEKCFASFSEVLLERVLFPYWKSKGSELVESEEPKPRSRSRVDDPAYIRVAEEFLAIRYLSLIRAVLVNMRYLMVFVSLSFVLAIIAWNSYPFEPRQFIDWVFTGMLAILGGGTIMVFAQMHRDPILNRITHTKANELGVEFYVRILAFGAVPVLTWLAYQFPDIGSTIFKFIKPGIEVIK